MALGWLAAGRGGMAVDEAKGSASRVAQPRDPQGRDAENRDSGLGVADDVGLCETAADYDALPSRLVIGQLLRSHVDARCVTPFEILHGGRQLRQVLEQRAMVDGALTRIAVVQGKMPGQDPRSRRAALQAALDGVILRVRSVDTALARGGEPQAGVAGVVEAALARDLAGRTTWFAKLDHLFSVLWQQASPPLGAAVDAVIGDILLSTAALRELLPPRTGLGAALCRLLEMVEGRIPMDATRSDRLGTMSQLFRQGRLPEARLAVFERIRRGLRGGEPLVSDNPERDAESFRTLLFGLVTGDGVNGGSAMAEALTLRYARRFNQGGGRGVRQAVMALTESLPTLPARVHYLAAMASGEMAGQLVEEVVNCLEGTLTREAVISALVFRAPDMAAVRRMLAAGAAALAASALPEAIRRRLAVQVEHVVDDFAISGDLLASADEQEPGSARQALRLADLVSSGLISNREALAAVRSRLSELTARPGFETELAAVKAAPSGIGIDLQRFRDVVNRPGDGEPALQTVTVSGVGQASGARPMPMAAQFAAAADVTRTVQQPVLRSSPQFQPPSPSSLGVRPRPPHSMASNAESEAPTVALSAGRPGAMPEMGLGDVTIADDSAKYGRDKARDNAAPRDDLCPNCFVRRGGGDACSECGYVDGVSSYSTAHLKPGTWLMRRYRVGKLLGQGGFGATYLGWDDRLHIKVAVKEYFPVNLVARAPGSGGMLPYTAEHVETFRVGIEKFLEEARTLAKLRDIREIVGVQDYFEDMGTAYLVMELLQGQTMKKFIETQGGRVDYRKALAIMMPIMKALHAVHELGLVHRDISPDNIFMTNGGGARLLDFGAARQSASEGGGGLTVILKPGYAPPEQYFSDSRQGPWTDVYALAASFYCALTGRPPADSARRIQEDALVKPSTMGIAVPPEVETVLLTGLALRYQDRYPSMRAMATAFAKCG